MNIKKVMNKVLKSLLVVMMVVSNWTGSTIFIHAEDDNVELTNPQKIVLLMDEVLDMVNVTEDMSDKQIKDQINSLDDNTYYALGDKMDAIYELEFEITEDDYAEIEEYEKLELFSNFYNAYYSINNVDLLASSVSLFNGGLTISDTRGNVSQTDNNVTVTVTAGKYDVFGKSNSITLTNTGSNTAVVSFNYSLNDASAVSHTYTMSVNDTINLGEFSASRNSTATVTLSNFTYTVVAKKIVKNDPVSSVEFNPKKSVSNQLDTLKQAIFAAVVNSDASLPEGINVNDVNIQYIPWYKGDATGDYKHSYDGVVGTGIGAFKEILHDLTAAPTSQSGHTGYAFGTLFVEGIKTTEKVRITGTGEWEDLYVEAEIALVDARQVSEIYYTDPTIIFETQAEIDAAVMAALSAQSTGNISATIVDGQTLPTGGQTKTLTYNVTVAEDDNYRANSTTVTITATAKSNPAQINIKINGEGSVSVGNLNGNGTLAEGDYAIVATPTSGTNYYVSSITWKENNGTLNTLNVSDLDKYDTGRSFSDLLTFHNGNVYEIEVTFAERTLTAKSNNRAGMSGYSDDTKKTGYNALMTASGFAPYVNYSGGEFTNVEVKMMAYWLVGNSYTSASALQDSHRDVPATKDFQVTWSGDARYPEITLSGISVYIYDNRPVTKIVVPNTITMDIRTIMDDANSEDDAKTVIKNALNKYAVLYANDVATNIAVTDNIDLTNVTLPAANGQYTFDATFSYAAKANYLGATSVTATITLTNNRDGATIAVGGNYAEQGTVVLDNNNLSTSALAIKGDQSYVATITPINGHSIKEVKLDGVDKTSSLSFVDDGVATLNIHSKENVNHVIDVTFVKNDIVLKDSVTYEYNGFYLEERTLTATDLLTMLVDSYHVELTANNTVVKVNDNVVTDANPFVFDALDSGDDQTINVEVTYNGDAQYLSTVSSVEVTLDETRVAANLVVESNDEDSYIDIAKLDELLADTLKISNHGTALVHGNTVIIERKDTVDNGVNELSWITYDITFPGDANYLPAKASSTVYVMQIVLPSNLTITEIGRPEGATWSAICEQLVGGKVPGNSSIVITINPQDNYVIHAVELTSGLTVNYENGKGTIAFTSGEDQNYEVKVTYAENKINLKDDDYEYNGFNKTSVTKEELFNHVFDSYLIPLTYNDVTITVDGVEVTNSYVLTDEKTVVVKVEYAGDNQYVATSSSVEFTLVDSRNEVEVSVVDASVELDIRDILQNVSITDKNAAIQDAILALVGPSALVDKDIVLNALNGLTLPGDDASESFSVVFKYAGEETNEPSKNEVEVSVKLTNMIKPASLKVNNNESFGTVTVTGKEGQTYSAVEAGVTVPGLVTYTVTADPNPGNSATKYYVKELVVYEAGTDKVVSSAVSYNNGTATVTFFAEETKYYTTEVVYGTYLDMVEAPMVTDFNMNATYSEAELEAKVLGAIYGDASYANYGSFNVKYKVGITGLAGYEDLTFKPDGLLDSTKHPFGKNGNETIRIAYTSNNAMYESFTLDTTIVVSNVTFKYDVVDNDDVSVFIVPFDPLTFGIGNITQLGNIVSLKENTTAGLLQNKTYYVVIGASEASKYVENIDSNVAWNTDYGMQYVNLDLSQWVDFALSGIVYSFNTEANANYTMSIDLESGKFASQSDLAWDYNPYTGELVEFGKPLASVDAQFMFDHVIDMSKTKPSADKALYKVGENVTVEYTLPTYDDFINSKSYSTTVKVSRAKDDIYPAVNGNYTVKFKDVRLNTAITYTSMDAGEKISFVSEEELLGILRDELSPVLKDEKGNVLDSKNIKIEYAGVYDDEHHMVSMNVIFSYAENANYRGTSVEVTGIEVADIPENINITVNSANGSAVLKNQTVGADGKYTVMGNGTYTVVATPNSGYAVESITVDCLADEAEAVTLTVDYLKQVGSASYMFVELPGSNVKDYVVTVNYVDSKIAFKDELKVPYKVGFDTTVPTNEEIYNAIVNAPSLEDAVVNNVNNQKITVTYKAREAGKYTVTIPPIKLLGIEIYKGGPYEVDQKELWLTPGTEIVETDVEALISEFIDTITSANILNAWDLFNELINDVLPNLQIGAHEFGAYGDGSTEIIRISYEDDKWNTGVEEKVITIYDDRTPTSLSGTDATVVYGQYSEAELLGLMNLQLVADGAAVETSISDYEFVTKKVVSLDAKDEAYQVVVRFKGNETYQPSEATINVKVDKAPLNIDYDSQVVTWGNDYTFELVTDPAGVDAFEFMIGIDADELSEDNLMPNGFIEIRVPGDFATILKLLGIEGSELSLNGLLDTLANLGGMGDDLLGSLGITNETVTQIVTSLQSILNMVEGIGDLSVKFNGNMHPTDVGVYLAFAVSYDSNYETAYCVDYLVIAPKTVQADLEFNMSDSNGLISADLIKDGFFDLGASAYIDGEKDAVVTEDIGHLFVTVNLDGEFSYVHMFENAEIKDHLAELSEIGGYAQLSYLLEWGNEFFYAIPAIRVYAVVPELCKVEFVDKDGNSVDTYELTYDRYPADEIFVNVYDNWGNKLSNDLLTVTYVGYTLNKPTEIYNSTVAPTDAGVYTAIAFYNNSEIPAYGADVALITIKPAETTLEVEEQTVIYGSDYDNGVRPGNADVNYITIVAGVDAGGNISLENMNPFTGVINMDLPRRLDAVLDVMLPGARENGISANEVLARMSEIEAYLVELGLPTEIVNTMVSVLNKIPASELGNVKVTFVDKFVPEHVGLYMVAAVTCDPNYMFAGDIGYLMVAPNSNKVELEFNYKDLNHMITKNYIEIGDIDMGSHVIVGGSTTAEIAAGATEHLANLFVGMDIDGNVVVSDEPIVEYGAYTQVAYIVVDDVNDLYYAEPIIRAYVIVPELVKVEFIDVDGNVNAEQQFTYTGQPQSMGVRVTHEDGTILDHEHLLLNYIGVDAKGVEFYNSHEAPTNVGVYSVIATYVDDENELYGITAGVMAINPTSSTIDVVEGTYKYRDDFTFPITTTPEGLEYVLITAGLGIDGSLVGENTMEALITNVNVDMPEWLEKYVAKYLPEGYKAGISLDTFINIIEENKDAIEGLINEYLGDQLSGILGSLGENVSIMDVMLQALDIVRGEEFNITVTFNDVTAPVAVGVYAVGAIVVDMNAIPSYDYGLVAVVPSVQDITLEYNENVTSIPLFEKYDLGAHANYADGTEIDDSYILHVFVKRNDDGSISLSYEEPTELGSYIQGTVVIDLDGEDAGFAYTYRILNVIKRNTSLSLVGARRVTYDGLAHGLKVSLMDRVSETEITTEPVSVTYVAKDAEGNVIYNSSEAPVDAGTYEVVATYVGSDIYVESNSKTTLIIDKAELGVEIADANKFVGDEDPTLSYEVVSGLVAGDEVVVDLVREAGEVEGTYGISFVLDADKAGNRNYFINEETAATFTITKRALELSAIENSKVYGDMDPAFTYGETGEMYKDQKASDAFDINVVRVAGENVGTYEMSIEYVAKASGVVVNGVAISYDDMYAISTVNNTFTIVTEVITNTNSSVADVIYNGNEQTPAVSVTDTVLNEVVTLVEGTDFEVVTYENNVNVGTASVTIRGIGNYSGETTIEFAVKPYEITEDMIAVETVTYNGSAQEPAVVVTFNGNALVEGVDYDVFYAENVNAGKGVVAVVGKGNFAGYVTKNFTILPCTEVLLAPIDDKVYTGSVLTPEAFVVGNNTELVNGVDYTVSYENNLNVGTATVEVYGMGNYQGAYATTTFAITPKALLDTMVSGVASELVYNGFEQKQVITVTDGKALVNGTDYTVTYSSDVTNAGTVTVTITGKGNYEGTVTRTYKIIEREITVVMDAKSKVFGENDPAYTHKVVGDFASGDTLDTVAKLTVERETGDAVGRYEVTYVVELLNTNYKVFVEGTTLTISPYTDIVVEDIAGAIYTGDAITPSVVVKAYGEVLDASLYTVEYKDNVNVGEATVVVTVGGNYNAKIEKTFKISPKSISGATLSGLQDVVYDGTAQKLPVVVTLEGKTLSSDDYTVSYENNVNVGTATVTVEGKGNYAGMIQATHEITVRKVTVVMNELTKIFGEQDPAYTHSVVGTFAGTDTLENVVTLTGTRDGGEDVGTYNTTYAVVVNNTNYEVKVLGSTLTIVAKSIADMEVSGLYDVVYNGAERKLPVTITGLTEGTDYEVSYEGDLTNVGTVTVTITGKGNYEGTIVKTYAIEAKDILDRQVSSPSDVTYNASEQKFVPVVTVEEKVLVEGTDYEVTYSDDLTNAGTVTVTVKGIGNYAGTIIREYVINPYAISEATITYTPRAEYTGSAIEQPVVITANGETLVEGVDYTLVYSNNVNAGAAKVTIIGKGNYAGSVDKFFAILAKSLTEAEISGLYNVVYDGNEHKLAPVVNLDGKTLTAGTDYTVTYSKDTTNVGTVTVTVKGNGNYSGTLRGEYAITPCTTIVVEDIASQVYTGNAIEPTVVVEGLSAKDYTVTYENNVNVGMATVTVTGKGNYEGAEVVKSFEITPKALTDAMVSNVADVAYNGTKHEPVVVVTDGKVLELNKDYVVTYGTNTNAYDEAFVKVTGIGNYSGEVVKSFIIENVSLEDAVVSAADQVYNGNELKPVVTVTLGDKTLVENVDYTVTYSDNKDAGEATITVTGKGNYSEIAIGTFTIAKREITVVMDPKSKVFGDAEPAYTHQVVGTLVNDDTLASVVTLTVNRVAGENVGTYAVTYDAVVKNTNYAVNVIGSTLTIVAETEVTVEDILGATYTGSEIKPAVVVKANGQVLDAELYSVVYKDNVNVGEATVVVTVGGNYNAVIEKSFVITAKSIEGATISGLQDVIYNGNEQKLVPTVKDGDVTLVEGTDYVVAYEGDLTNVGTVNVIITGKGNYAGIISGSYKIAAKDVTVVMNAATKVFGETDPVFTHVVNGLVNGDTLKDVVTLTVSREAGEDVGTYDVTYVVVVTNNNYKVIVTGSTLTITPSKDVTVDDVADVTYTGEEMKPAVVVKGNGQVLDAELYSVEYVNNVNAGLAKVIVTVGGNYDAKIEKLFVIKAQSIENAAINGLQDVVYDGKEHKLVPVVTLGETTLVEGTDYEVAYEGDLTNTGNVVVTITGKGNYEGTLTKEYAVTAYELGATNVNDFANVEYTGKEHVPSVVVKANGATLVEGVDYVVEITNNTNVGTATVTVTGKGNYSGTIVKTFAITAKTVTVVMDAQTKVFGEVDPTYTHVVTGLVNNDTLADVVKLTVNRVAGENVGTYAVTYVTEVLNNNYVVVVTGSTLTITPSKDVTVEDVADATYTGKEIRPVVVVKGNGEVLASDAYSVSYENNIDAGTAKVVVTVEGNYEAVIEKEFVIKAKGLDDATISGLTDVTYNGNEQKLVPTVKVDGTTLVEGKDYEVSYSDDLTNAGTVTVTITGKGNYAGTVTEEYVIAAKALGNATVSSADQVYSGNALKPAVVVALGNKALTENVDYTIAYSNNTNAGTATITITGMGNYSGEAFGSFNIEKRSITVVMDPKSKVYGDADPAYTHKVVGEFAGNDTLDSIATLTAKRTAGENVGTYDVTYVVTMKNTNYVVTVVSSTLTITAETEVTVEDILGATYTGSEIKPAVVVKANGQVLDASEYTVTYTNNVNVGTATVKVTVGGNYNAVIEKSFAISAKSLDGAVISGVEDKEYTGSAITQDVVVTLDGKTLVEGTDYVVTYKNNVNVGVATVVVTGKGNYVGKVSKEFTVIKTVDENVYRLYGDDRYETAYQVALTLKDKLGVDKFETVVIASGLNFADALAGTYLANKFNAPILMTDSKDKNVAQLKAFINEHAVKGAKVYILGGNAAVKANVDKALKGYDVKRLAGADRYATNLEILKEVGVGNETIIVATGTNFADSLSASATGLPILLVNKKLSVAQTQFLKSAGQHNYVIAGGLSAVNETVEKQIGAYGQVERLAGEMRYHTSVMIAERFFNNPDYAVVALATNFPDGLSGGALAYALDAPMLLTNKDAKNYKITSTYSNTNDVRYGYVLGGPTLVTDKATGSVFSIGSDRKIVVNKYAK